MTKYATINPLDNSVFAIHDVMAASDLPAMPGAPFVVAAGDETAVGDIYDPATAGFTTPEPPPPIEEGGEGEGEGETPPVRRSRTSSKASSSV